MRFLRQDISIDKNGNPYESYIFIDNDGTEHPFDSMIMRLNVYIPFLNKNPLTPEVIRKMEKFMENLKGAYP